MYIYVIYKANSYAVGSVSRKGPFSPGSCFDWILPGLLLSSASRFYSFCALFGGGWCERVLLHGSRKSVGGYVFVRSPRVTHALRATNPRPSVLVGGVGLSRNSPKLRSWHSFQLRAANAAAGVAVVVKMTYIPRCCDRMIHAAGERS